MGEEREAQMKKSSAAASANIDPKKSAGLRNEEASRAAEEDIAEQLFAAEVGVDSAALKSEKDYVKFAQQVSQVLYNGHAGYNIPAFFDELVKGVGKSSVTTTEDVKKILDIVTVVYNTKVAEEKKKDASKAKKASAKAKPSIA